MGDTCSGGSKSINCLPKDSNISKGVSEIHENLEQWKNIFYINHKLASGFTHWPLNKLWLQMQNQNYVIINLHPESCWCQGAVMSPVTPNVGNQPYLPKHL